MNSPSHDPSSSWSRRIQGTSQAWPEDTGNRTAPVQETCEPSDVQNLPFRARFCRPGDVLNATRPKYAQTESLVQISAIIAIRDFKFSTVNFLALPSA